MKKFAGLAFVIFSLAFVPTLPSQVLFFAGGDGTPTNPYQIADCYQLQQMNNYLSASFVLINDIDCSGTIGWNSGAGFMPIGTYSSSPFTGTFDGQNHKIAGLVINRPFSDYVGLFGFTGSGAIIKDVGLVGVSITGNNYVGGLVGENGGAITNSYATGSVSGSEWVGGLVGRSNYGAITNSYSTGSVSGSDAGGLVGLAYHGVITNSFATGSVIKSNSIPGTSEGGLVGSTNQGAITNSFATGSVSSGDFTCCHVGGLVGSSFGTIINSYSTGSVSGNGGTVGGLAGALGPVDISNSYSTGSVNGIGSYLVGGLVAQTVEGGTITDSYWDKETSGTSTSAGGTGKTTAEMKTQSTFVDWNFVNIWAIDEGVSYPYFLWQIPPDPAAAIGALIGTVKVMNLKLIGIEESLVAKLNAALASLNRGQKNSAKNQLSAFINACQAQKGKALTVAQADQLIGEANKIIAAWD